MKTPRKRATLPAFTPVPRKAERSNGWKPEVQRAFIEALAETGSVRSAARRVNRAEVGAYMLRRHPEAAEFRHAWDVALDIGMRRIEDVAMDRALNGVEVPVYSYGKIVGTRVVYNDRLLMFMLRNRAPERFTEGPNRTMGAKSPNAVDEMQLKRLKKQWREEWEAELAEAARERARHATQAMDDRLERVRQSWLDRMSPKTRAAQLEDDEARWAPLRERDAKIMKGEVRYSSSAPNDYQLPVACTPISPHTSRRTHPAPWDEEWDGDGEE